MKRESIVGPLLLALVLGAGFGCGYALVGTASNIPAHVQTVHLEPLENRTRRSEVEQILTEAIAQELVTRRRFDLVDDREAADALLDGAVLRFDVRPLNFDAQGRTTEYQITINLQMRFFDRVEEQILWANDSYTYKESYPVEASDIDYFDQEKLAIEEAAETFARTMIIDLLEGF
ncbi:MAG: LptE family protein [Thermoanaerobaculia bacterium]|nr:LptE family protein [Thermoanaerobaculia bacterium]